MSLGHGCAPWGLKTWREDSLGPHEARIRSLPDRLGRTTLILLVAILVLGFGLRAYRVAEPLRTPGDDAAAYYDLSKSLYEEGSYGSPGFRDAERLVAGGAAALRRLLLRDRRRPRRDGADRRAAARGGGDPRRLRAGPADRLPAGGADRGIRGRRLPALHPLDRRPLQRAARDLHAARGGAGLLLGGRTGARCGRGSCPGSLRPHRTDPARVPGGRGRLRSAGGDPGRQGTRLAAGVGGGRADASPRSCCRSCPGRCATSSSSTASCRSRPAAARRSTSAPTCRPTANTSGSRRSWSSATWAATSTPGSEALDEVDPAPLFDRVADALPRPAARRGAGQDRQREPLRLPRRRPGRLRGDDRPQGLADVERGHRRSDELDRRAGRPDRDRPRSRWRGSACSPGGAGGGSWSRWRPRSRSSPPSAPPRWPPRDATRS